MILDTKENVRFVFRYDRRGFLIWNLKEPLRLKTGPRKFGERNRRVGGKFGTRAARKKRGMPYLQIRFAGRDYYEHRLIFLWHHGYLPEQVDHKNRVKTVNRIGNLRASDPVHNGNNRGATVRSVTGVKGVYPRGNKFAAFKTCHGTQHYLGVFASVRTAERAQLGFRP